MCYLWTQCVVLSNIRGRADECAESIWLLDVKGVSPPKPPIQDFRLNYLPLLYLQLFSLCTLCLTFSLLCIFCMLVARERWIKVLSIHGTGCLAVFGNGSITSQ